MAMFSGVLACATATGRWVIDTVTPAGQPTAAAVMTAYALGKTLWVRGSNSCNAWFDTETVEYVVLSD
jgi:hypothetical protein